MIFLTIWTAELITSICAVIIAVCALVVSIWQGFTTRKHNRLSSEPYLTIYKAPNGDLKIENSGTGLAIIEELSFKISKKKFDVTDPNYWRKLKSTMGPEYEGKTTIFYLTSGTRIQAGMSYPIITWTENMDDGSDQLNKYTRKAKFQIVYSSMYGEEFHYGEH